ncbi:MAG TPA: PD-(D/E)XK nuclease family protein [Candidatus Tumulicola sp.]
MLADSPDARAFFRSAIRWCRTGDRSALAALIRSQYSGVPHDVGAAYATLASRTGTLLESIAEGKLGLPPPERDAVLEFAARARRLRASAEELDDASLHALIATTFESRSAEPAARAAADRSAPVEIALAEPCEREVPTGVAARQRHFSPSSLNAYAECPRKWFYRYACAAVEDRGSSAATYGTAFHLALEDFHGEFPRPRASDEAAMRRRVTECVTWAFERNRDGFETAVEFELQRRRARRTAQRYIDWLLVQERVAPFEVVGREVAAELELGGRAFVGFIDRLDRDERSGGIGVVDYKTGSIAATAADYREKIRQFRDFQLPFYYWARTAAGDRVTRLALVPLKDALLDVRPIVLEVVFGSATEPRRSNASAGTIAVSELERARARMIEISGELASGTVARFAVTKDAAACRYCAYAVACAGRPPELPERFAR